MASDKKTKATPAAKPETVAKAETPASNPVAAAATETTAAPAEKSSGYSRGEGQKVVTQAYKDNWNAIFGKTAKPKTVKRKSVKPKTTKTKKKR